MPTFFQTVDADGAFARFDAIGPRARQALKDTLAPIAAELQSEAREIAIAHFHSIGKKPGLYLESLRAGVSDKGPSIVGWLRSGNALAHLLELGFTISDLIIPANSGGVMAFEEGGVRKFAKSIHRHETKVDPYPAIGPAFEAHRGEILAALERVKQTAVD